MTEQALAKASELAPIIERVHGEHHPELTRVRELTELIANADGADVAPYFAELRTVTSNYAIPDDVCETFEATYAALEQAESELVNQ
ncbi:MAG: hypothetical protein Q4G35_02890 [Propionibacteriaceae bacterium]|nr:hypothetical protein [Propionibacteriaceae bacterium]